MSGRTPGIRIPDLTPGSPEWLQKISASKVAAILGLSPWQSRFGLWHEMTGRLDAEEQTPEQARGHYLEPAIAAWFLNQHPDLDVVLPGGTWQHPDHDWATANPDGLLIPSNAPNGAAPSRILELKTDADNDPGWGEPGSDEIPAGYRAQVQWQMWVTGTDVCHVAFLSSYLRFAEYVIHYDPEEAEEIRLRCEEFLADLRNGVRPNLDSHAATYSAVRRLHPGIDYDRDEELPPELAEAYCTSRRRLAEAKAEAQLQATRVAALLGDARRARYDGQTLAYRMPGRGDKPPALRAAKTLPNFDAQETAA